MCYFEQLRNFILSLLVLLLDGEDLQGTSGYGYGSDNFANSEASSDHEVQHHVDTRKTDSLSQHFDEGINQEGHIQNELILAEQVRGGGGGYDHRHPVRRTGGFTYVGSLSQEDILNFALEDLVSTEKEDMDLSYLLQRSFRRKKRKK